MERWYDGLPGTISTAAMMLAAGFSYIAMDADHTATRLEPMLREYPGLMREFEPSEPAMSARSSEPLPGYVVDTLATYLEARDEERRFDTFTGIAIAAGFVSGLAAFADRRTVHEAASAAARDARYFGSRRAEAWLSAQAQRFEPE